MVPAQAMNSMLHDDAILSRKTNSAPVSGPPPWTEEMTPVPPSTIQPTVPHDRAEQRNEWSRAAPAPGSIGRAPDFRFSAQMPNEKDTLRQKYCAPMTGLAAHGAPDWPKCSKPTV